LGSSGVTGNEVTARYVALSETWHRPPRRCLKKGRFWDAARRRAESGLQSSQKSISKLPAKSGYLARGADPDDAATVGLETGSSPPLAPPPL